MQACWAFLGKEIQEVVEESRWLGSFHATLNAMFLALAPKACPFEIPEAFRPISLCRMLFKIISMVIVD